MALERLSVHLTEDERSMRAREAAMLLGEYARKEEEKKDRIKILSDDLKDLRTRADAAAAAANSGVEEREVPISPRPNNDRYVVEYFRDDTGDLVRTRPMTDDEMRVARQQVLPLRTSTTTITSPLRGNTRPPIDHDKKPS